MHRLLLAVLLSGLLTLLTIMPPMIPTDWARLDRYGAYVPERIEYPWPSYAVQVGLWVGMTAALLGSNPTSLRIWLARRRVTGRSFSPTPPPCPLSVHREEEKNISLEGSLFAPVEENARWVAGVSLTALILLGFGLRAHTLDDLPLIVDEIGFAAQASDILHGQHVPIFAPGHNANPSVFSWLAAGMMGLFGQNGFAIRLIPLFFGTLSVPAVYLLGRIWWSRRVGLLAAAFLATYPAHVFFSRLSLYNLVDPVFAMLALAFLGRALKRGGRRDYVLAGMMAGYAQYFYHGARLVVVLMGLLAIGYWLLEKDLCRDTEEQRSREIFTGLLWAGIAFAVMAMPRFAPMVVGGLPLEGNREVMRLPGDFWPDNVARAVLAWVGQRDVSPFWLNDAPLLLWPAMVMFLVGLVVSARRWRDGRYAVLLASVALTMIFGGAIWTAAPLYVRYMTAVPAIALLIAVSFQASAFSQKWYAAFVLLLIVCVQGIVVSLWQHPAEARARITAGQWWADETARDAAALPEDAPLVLLAPPEFGELERITLADYVAAYGERRSVAVLLSPP